MVGGAVLEPPKKGRFGGVPDPKNYRSKLESLSPSSRWILFKNTGSGEVEREARQPRARQRHLGRGEPPAPRIMMSGEVCSSWLLCVWRTVHPLLPPKILLPRPQWVGGGSERGGGGGGQWWAAVNGT